MNDHATAAELRAKLRQHLVNCMNSVPVAQVNPGVLGFSLACELSATITRSEAEQVIRAMDGKTHDPWWRREAVQHD